MLYRNAFPATISQSAIADKFKYGMLIALASLAEMLASIEHAPNVQMQTGQPGTRRNPAALGICDGWDSAESDMADVRPRGKRCHLAEFFDTDGEAHDKMDTNRLGLKDFTEPPSDDEEGL